MKTPKHSLRKIVSFLNNPDEDGGFWLPNIPDLPSLRLDSEGIPHQHSADMEDQG